MTGCGKNVTDNGKKPEDDDPVDQEFMALFKPEQNERCAEKNMIISITDQTAATPSAPHMHT